MIDPFTLAEYKNNNELLELKIKSLEFAISQSEKMISESRINQDALIFLRRKIAQSQQDLEILYLIKNES